MNHREDPTYRYTEAIYEDNRSTIHEMAELLSKHYDLSEQTVLDTIKKEIYLAQESHKRFEQKNNSFKSWITFYLSILYSFLSSLFYRSPKKEHYDIVYEEMWLQNSWYKRVYSYLKFDSKFTEAILFVPVYFIKPFRHLVFNEGTLPFINRYRSNYIFDREISAKVFRNEFFLFFTLLQLTRKSQYDFMQIYLRILRKVLIYTTQIKNINAKVIIGTGDYYWGPLKYEIYKKSFANIVLIQYALKNKFSSEGKWISCDYYFGYSRMLMEERCDGLDVKKEMLYCGNIQLTPFTDKIGSIDTAYDILFIHQPYYVDFFKKFDWLDQESWKTEYLTLVKNIKRFADEFPQYSVCYFGKKGQDNPENNIYSKEVIDILNGDNIYQSYTSGYDSYMNLLKSTVIINQISTLGYDALGLNKKTLWINYGNILDGYEFDVREEAVDVLIDNSYEAFKNKILLLLSAQNDVAEFYKNRKKEYMNVTANPGLAIRDKINELLEN